MTIARQREAVAEWKERFKSFRSGSFADASSLARSTAGRNTLQSALNALIEEVREEDQPDYEMFDHLGRDLAACWPHGTAPTLATPKNSRQKLIVGLIVTAFARHGAGAEQNSKAVGS